VKHDIPRGQANLLSFATLAPLWPAEKLRLEAKDRPVAGVSLSLWEASHCRKAPGGREAAVAVNHPRNK